MPTSKHMGFQKACEFQNQCPVCHHLFTAGGVTAVGQCDAPFPPGAWENTAMPLDRTEIFGDQ